MHVRYCNGYMHSAMVMAKEIKDKDTIARYIARSKEIMSMAAKDA